MRPERGAAYRLLIVGLVCWATAAVVYGTLRLSFGPRPVYIHVRWAPAVDEAARERLEQVYSLSLGELREGRTWGYRLLDVSRNNIRTLVGDAAVEDTHYIHRTAFRPWRFAPRRPFPTRYQWIPAGLEILTLLSLLAGAASIGLALLERLVPGAIRGPMRGMRNTFLDPRGTFDRGARRFVAWLRTRIPGASARSVALFRVVFGSALLIIVLRRSVRAEWATQSGNVVSAAQEFFLRIFADAPWIVGWIEPWLVFWGALFIAGAMARTAFAMTTLGVFAWAVLYTTRMSHHTVAALLLALVCLLWSRWGDAWSVDAWWRRRSAPGPKGSGLRDRGTPQEYGYTVWVPGLVLGVVFAAAAFAKLRDSGVAWILNGTVKYHFLSDSGQAMVDWGLQLGQHHALAVLMSFTAIAIESLVIVGVLSRRYRYRLIAGLAAMSLLAGFALLQGLFWPGWWILLLSFLPWHLARPASHREATAGDEAASLSVPWRHLLQPAAVVVILVLFGQQIVVSLLRIEASPLISKYDMYSTTYGSPAEYEEKAGQGYWMLATDEAGEPHECRITREDADLMARAASRSEDRPAALEVVQRCFEPSLHVRSLSLETRRTQVDWARWRVEEPARVPLLDTIPMVP